MGLFRRCLWILVTLSYGALPIHGMALQAMSRTMPSSSHMAMTMPMETGALAGDHAMAGHASRLAQQPLAPAKASGDNLPGDHGCCHPADTVLGSHCLACMVLPLVMRALDETVDIGATWRRSAADPLTSILLAPPLPPPR